MLVVDAIAEPEDAFNKMRRKLGCITAARAVDSRKIKTKALLEV
jgi:hypothetical protein